MANKLSNYGDALRLMGPSSSWKTICGWTNHSGMVTVHEMKETEVGYSVSKSSESMGSASRYIDKGVKEQRVDGNWCFHLSNPIPRRAMRKHLRYTLMGLERDYQVEIPSNQFKYYSALATAQVQEGNVTLNPNFITGFTDAEGSFTVTIYPDNLVKTAAPRKSNCWV